MSENQKDLSDSNTLESKVKSFEATLADLKAQLDGRTVELEAHEGLLDLAMKEMRGVYDELLQSQAQLLHADKLATIGLLSAGIVHELNNPLGAIQIGVSLLNTKFEDLRRELTRHDLIEEPAIKESLRVLGEVLPRCGACAENMGKIVRNVRLFCKSPKQETKPEDLNELIESVISIFWNTIGRHVTLKREFGTLPPVECNSQQLGQVFLNLIVNAAQAIETAGMITIRTGVQDGFVRLDFEDTGKGMSPEVKAKIFKPFFTTKEEKGTGLGLSISQGIVQKHGGTMTVESEAGKGTVFTVRLPLTQSS